MDYRPVRNQFKRTTDPEMAYLLLSDSQANARTEEQKK